MKNAVPNFYITVENLCFYKRTKEVIYVTHEASISMFFICNLIFLHVTFDITFIYCYITKLFNMNEKLFGIYEEIISNKNSLVYG